jgi:protein involved in polysaccharide export with SLBB domain
MNGLRIRCNWKRKAQTFALPLGVQRAREQQLSCFFVLLLFFVAAPPAHAQLGAAEILQQTAVTGVNKAYRLASGDAISIHFFYNPELDVDTQLRPDGRISLALLGEVLVSNLTIAELTSQLETLYKDILRRTAVTIQVTNYANRKFFVGGEVERPGIFSLTGQQTVLGAVLEAGGMKKSAKTSEVYLVRRTDSENAEALRISLEELPQQPSQASTFPVEPYDVVIVAESTVARANRIVDQYVRQMLPMLVSVGFQYLLNGVGTVQ